MTTMHIRRQLTIFALIVDVVNDAVKRWMFGEKAVEINRPP